MDYFLNRLIKRCEIKAAALNASAEPHHNGMWHVPENIGLRAEARAVEAFGSALQKLVGVEDDVFDDFDDLTKPSAAEPVKLDFKIVPPAEPQIGTEVPETTPNDGGSSTGEVITVTTEDEPPAAA